MSSETSSNGNHDHDVKSILMGLAAAFVMGVIVVVTIIWPAEYGKDPTGVGTLLGLTRMSADELAEAETRPPEPSADSFTANAAADQLPVASSTTEKVIPITVWPLESMEVARAENIQIHTTAFRTDKAEVTLQTGEAVEYKAELLEGEPLMFSWTTIGGEIYTDLHAEPTVNTDRYPEHYFYRYDESEGTEGHGYFMVPFTGKHGWYWLNRNASPVTVRLEISGFHTSLTAIVKETQKPAN